jgi:hypothetical protein
MSAATYNGWTNYNTWKVNLEFFDGMSYEEFAGTTTEGLAEELKEMVEVYIDEHTSSTLAWDWAMETLRDVDWYAIAEQFIKTDEY